MHFPITSGSLRVRAASCEKGDAKNPCLTTPDSLCSPHICIEKIALDNQTCSFEDGTVKSVEVKRQGFFYFAPHFICEITVIPPVFIEEESQKNYVKKGVKAKDSVLKN